MFKFKGISSHELGVVAEEPTNLVARAAQRHEIIDVVGKDGASYRPLGYASIPISLALQVMDVSKLDEIMAWLNGVGELEYEGRKTTVRIYNAIETTRTSKIRLIDVEMVREPFWYKIDDEFKDVSTSINNVGNVYSRPIIRLKKGSTDSVEVSVNGTLFKYTFLSDEYVDIDCEEMNAYSEGFLRNKQLEIGFNFPALEPGMNIVRIMAGHTKIQIKNESRWL